MKAARACRMAQISHALRLAKDFRPRHFIQMVCKCHWVRDEFQTIVQAAVRLDAQIFRVRIGDVQQFFGIVTVCAAVVDFQCYAEVPQTLAVENKVGRVAVLVNDRALFVPTGRTVSVVVIIPIRAVAMNNAAAVIAEPVISHLKHFIYRMIFTAICTNSCFTHCLFLHFVW